LICFISTFYIPSQVAGQTLQQPTTPLSKTDENQTRWTWFGVDSFNVTLEIAKTLGMREAKGFLVTDVIPGSPAEKAGIRGGYTLSNIDGKNIKLGGDVILKADNKNLTKLYDMLDYIQKEKKEGDNITLTVFRDGQVKEINLPINARFNFSTYENPNYKIRIEYPLDWEKVEDDDTANDRTTDIVTFYSPLESDSDTHLENLWISIDNLDQQNITLEEYIDETIDTYRKYAKDFSLVELDSNTTFAGNSPAYKLVYTSTEEDDVIKTMEIGTMIDNKVYYISYLAEAKKYSEYLPMIQRMIDSFKIDEYLKYENYNSEGNFISSLNTQIMNNSVTTSSLADYTFMVYMVGSDLESKLHAASKDIREMVNAGSTSRVNVIIETGGGNAQSTIEDDKRRFIDFTKVQRHEVLNNNFTTLSDLGQQNMGDPKTVSDFIIWGMTEFPAKKYAIIFWDHGSGINGFGRDILFNNDTLNLGEINTAFALAKKTTNKNFELIGFDACLMASIEVANTIKSFGNYMVSSEEVEPSWGWDYTAILRNLTENPEQDGVSLGRTIADSFLKHSQTFATSQGFDAQQIVTLSVVDLTKISQLIKELDSLSSYVDGKVTDFPSAISLINSMDFTERYGQSARGSSGLADLYDLTSNIEAEYPQSKNLVDAVKMALKSAIVYKLNGESKPNANGLSIYMPLRESEFSNSSIYSPAGWQKIVNFQHDLIKSDKDFPIVEADFDGETIRGHIYSDDISSTKLFIYSSLSEGKRVFYQELEPSSIININGSLEYKWNNQILSLCNEQTCTPTLVDLEVNKDKKFVLIPARLESDTNNINENVSLIYEIDEGGAYKFLGARPEINEQQGAIPKEQHNLEATDKIYPLTYTFEWGQDALDIDNVEYDSIKVNNIEKFVPEYITYEGTFDIQFQVCDYSNNCWETRLFHFNDTAKIGSLQSSLSGDNEKISKEEKDACLNTIDNFSVYENPDYGFKIQYPSDWEKEEQGLPDPWVVAFSSPLDAASITVSSEYWPYQESPKDISDFYKQFPFHSLIESNATILADNPAHKIVFTYKVLEFGLEVWQRMYIVSKIEDTLYEIHFSSPSSNFSDYLPVVKQVIDSFEINTDKPAIDQDQVSNCGINKNRSVIEGPDEFGKDIISVSNFSVYENPDYGFKIQYPSDWEKEEEQESFRIVTFITYPETKPNISSFMGDSFLEQFGISVDQASEWVPLNESVSLMINTIREDHIGFNLIDSNTTTFKGNLAYIIVFTFFDAEHRIQIKQMSIITTIGDHMYLFEYITELPNYERYLPIIENMIDSFEVTRPFSSNRENLVR
jgi:hypothetical protein